MTLRSANDESLYLVASVNGPTAKLVPLRGGDGVTLGVDDQVPVERATSELVVVAEFGDPIYPGLKRVGSLSRGDDKPAHVVINGENHHALEALQFTHAGKVDCVYIDPPYNTGARDWKYNNDYVDDADIYKHSKWLAFIERRLTLAKALLNPADSVLIVTIDEKEYLRLGLLLEQVFPAARIQMVDVLINPAVVARAGSFGRSDEYAFFVMLGSASPDRVRLPREWVSSKGRTHTGNVRWDLLRRSGPNIGVLERRTEIGVRRALGATKGHIRLQFLLEAVLPGLLGGAAGVGIGVAATTGYTAAQDQTLAIPPNAIAIGLTAAVVIGAIAGLSPATLAARLAPAEAIRPS